MKRLLSVITAIILSCNLFAQDTPLWMRYSKISPDGTTIAFTYKGDIYTVPVTGGKAVQVTTNPAFDTRPVWSPDSKNIAFASDRMGSLDVFVVPKEGGEPRRLTTFSGNETPVCFLDNDRILFLSNIMRSADDSQFPSGRLPQVYEIGINGGRAVMFSSMTMEDISINKDGTKLLYHDIKGYEDPWRKHQVSSIARDIWLCNLGEERSYEKQTSFGGEDRNPVWAPDGESFYYLSEENGSFNVFKRHPGSSAATQITRHDTHPVRFLSIAGNGTLCYGYDGEIYTLKEGSEPQKISIDIVADKNDKDLIRQIRNWGATQIAVSPNGKEVAFIQRGDVYVTSVEYKTTKQITNTPEQERNIDFSPDGRSLVYSSERNGLWQLYQASIVRKDESMFAYATEIKEEKITDSDVASFQPRYSPDGKEIAFLENRTTIKVINLKNRKTRTVMDGKYQYSYSDGDQWFQWSPDGKWLLTQTIDVGGWNNTDIALVKADGKGEMHNLTQSGYSDYNCKWVLDGKAMIWKSDRAGFRSHGSWGSHGDVYIMFFDLEAYERFRMNKEDLALFQEAEKEKNKKKKDETEEDKEDDKKKDIKELDFDLENCRDRIIRLTINSSSLGDAILTAKGDKVYYQAAFESGYDLWVHNLKERETKILIKNVGYGMLTPSKDGNSIFMCSGGGLKKIDAASGKTTPIEFEAFFDYRPYEERTYIFDHVWQQVDDKFYVKDLHGIDWAGYKTAYEKFLPHINNNYDFAEMLSELLGELNGSHTGARYGGSSAAMQTAELGVFYDDTYTGDGLKIKEIIANGPFAVKKSEVKAGDVITKIDGVEIKSGEDYFPLLEGKAGRKVVLTVKKGGKNKTFEETVKAISSQEQYNLLYKRWVEQRRKMVDKLSNGRLGYVHVRSMNSSSFREVYRDLLGRYRNKEAVIVDTRHNGGGWLHDDLATLLNGKEYQRFVPRGQYIGSDPFNKWNKPSCVLVCEDNYSNAHGFPWLYKHLGIGKLIGAPVPGTMTAVWWEQQIDPSLVFGIPQVGCQDMDGNYLENQQLEPDILIYNEPAESLKGKDRQLEVGVETLLRELDS